MGRETNVFSLPEPVRHRVEELARVDGVSIDAWVERVLLESISRWETAAFFKERTQGMSWDEWEEILARVPDHLPPKPEASDLPP